MAKEQTSMLAQVQANSEPSAQVTWGIEVEFLWALLDKNLPDPHPEDSRRVEVLNVNHSDSDGSKTPVDIWDTKAPECFSDLFRRYGLCEELDDLEGRFDKRKNYTVNSPTPVYVWSLTSDPSVQPSINSTIYRWVGLEINSPVFGDRPRDNLDIRTMCRALRDNMRIQVNDTTGLHVHVGLGEDCCLPMRTKRKLLVLAWLLEQPLYDLCHPRRASGRYCHKMSEKSVFSGLRVEELSDTHGNSRPWRAFLGTDKRKGRRAMNPTDVDLTGPDHIPHELLERINPDLAIRLMAIWSAREDDLQAYFNCSLLRDDPRLGIRYDTPHETVEFRMLEGTVDAELIIDWAGVCTGIFEIAHKSTPEQFKAYVAKIATLGAEGRVYTWNDMVVDLELGGSIRRWWKRMFDSHSERCLEFQPAIDEPGFFEPPVGEENSPEYSPEYSRPW